MIHRVVRFVEEKSSAFGVSRLIMLSGVPVRNYEAASPDDYEALQKIDAVLPALLSDEEREELRRLTGF